MAAFELNIYGNNDEITKTYSTDHVRWGVYMQALEIKDEIEGMDEAEKFKMINGFVKKIFPELTDSDLENADGGDVINTFRQLIAKSNKIGGKTKNVSGAV